MKYLVGNEKIFYDFVKGIKKNDKVAIISHNDFDGVAAIVFLQKILNSQKIKSDLIYFSTYALDMFNKYIGEMKKKKISKVFVVDIQGDSAALDGFKKLREEFDVFWIDHHPLIEGTNYNQTLKTDTYDCATLILFNLSKNHVNVLDFNWLLCAAMVSDWSFRNSENMEYIRKFYPDFDENNFNSSGIGKLVITINNSLIYYKENEKKVFESLKKNDLKSLEKTSNEVEKEIQKVVKDYFERAEFYPDKNLYFYYTNPRFHLTSVIPNILSMKVKDKTIVFASDIENEMVKVSARNQSGEVDLGKILKKSVENLENSSGGGHIRASAATIMKKDLEEFKKRLLENIN